MRQEVIVHIANEEAFLADVDGLPNPTDTFLLVTSPRKRDGKPVAFGTEGVQQFLIPWHRITYVEVMPSERQRTDVFDFVREQR